MERGFTYMYHLNACNCKPEQTFRTEVAGLVTVKDEILVTTVPSPSPRLAVHVIILAEVFNST